VDVHLPPPHAEGHPAYRERSMAGRAESEGHEGSPGLICFRMRYVSNTFFP